MESKLIFEQETENKSSRALRCIEYVGLPESIAMKWNDVSPNDDPFADLVQRYPAERIMDFLGGCSYEATFKI